jgi:hypothetical protein
MSVASVDVAGRRFGGSAAARAKAPVLAPVATAFLKGYKAYRAAQLGREDVAASQERQLLRLVAAARDTRFGKDHDFGAIRSIADFQARVPLRTYTQLWDGYWSKGFPNLTDVTWPGRLPFYAVSSGTSTGKVKYIPCSDAMVRANKKGALDILVHHMLHRPDCRMYDGQFFMLGGSTNLVEQAPGVLSGDISGIAAYRTPWWGKAFQFPPPEIRFLTDWEEKLARMAPLSLQRSIRGMSGSPPWMLVLFEKLASLTGASPGRLADIYPDLELVVHGGVSMAPYRKRFDAFLAGSKARTQEVYAASEGFVAVADRGSGEGMRLVTDTGIFYEFVPVAELGADTPTRHTVATVETGVDYAIVMTTCAGLWGYLIGDVVRFVDRARPRLLITGRTSYMLSSFGEHVTGELIETCVLEAARASGLEIAEFTVGTEFADGNAWGRHAYTVETATAPSPERVAAFTDVLDRELAARNEDYAERRVVPTGLQRPVVTAVRPGAFKAWMKSKGKLGGQHKVPRVVTNGAFAEVHAFMADWRA